MVLRSVISSTVNVSTLFLERSHFLAAEQIPSGLIIHEPDSGRSRLPEKVQETRLYWAPFVDAFRGMKPGQVEEVPF